MINYGSNVLIAPPSDTILTAFGAESALPVLVDGGQGVTFRAGDLAIKQCDDPRQTEWLSGVMEQLEEKDFRIARPVRNRNGNFVIDGWCASRWLDGTTVIGDHWHEVINACQSFHRALSNIQWSPALQRPDNPYDQADCAVWDEWLAEMTISPVVTRLRRMISPITLPSQLIHGDLSEGNFLLTPGKPPAIIDIAPYWHPSNYAVAVLIADGIAWSGAPHSLLDDVANWPQMGSIVAPLCALSVVCRLPFSRRRIRRSRSSARLCTGYQSNQEYLCLRSSALADIIVNGQYRLFAVVARGKLMIFRD